MCIHLQGSLPEKSMRPTWQQRRRTWIGLIKETVSKLVDMMRRPGPSAKTLLCEALSSFGMRYVFPYFQKNRTCTSNKYFWEICINPRSVAPRSAAAGIHSLVAHVRLSLQQNIKGSQSQGMLTPPEPRGRRRGRTGTAGLRPGALVGVP